MTPKERKQMEKKNFEAMHEILHINNGKRTCGDQYEYWKKRVNERINFIQPLIDELKLKGISLGTLSKELNEEWLELNESKEYYNF
jgi:hypothetical protein